MSMVALPPRFKRGRPPINFLFSFTLNFATAYAVLLCRKGDRLTITLFLIKGKSVKLFHQGYTSIGAVEGPYDFLFQIC